MFGLKINPNNILAVTFTNKAANEMKERLMEISDDFSQMMGGTISDDFSQKIGTISDDCYQKISDDKSSDIDDNCQTLSSGDNRQKLSPEDSIDDFLTATGLVPARLVKRDPANDLAMLKAEGQHTALSVAPSRGVKLGQSVATIGFPNVGLQGFSPKLARGEIASLAGAQDDARHFQISVPVQPGNSGGPLVDLRGNVVGVIVGKLNQAAAVATSGTLAENVNYAIKSGFLLSFLESMPPVISQLPQPAACESTFEAIVAEVEKSTVLVVVYR